jgi:hypothetical protein
MGNSWVAEWLAASQLGFSPMELVRFTDIRFCRCYLIYTSISMGLQILKNHRDRPEAPLTLLGLRFNYCWPETRGIQKFLQDGIDFLIWNFDHKKRSSSLDRVVESDSYFVELARHKTDDWNRTHRIKLSDRSSLLLYTGKEWLFKIECPKVKRSLSGANSLWTQQSADGISLASGQQQP